MNNKHIGIHNSVFRVGIVYSVNGREVKIRVDHNKNSSSTFNSFIFVGVIIRILLLTQVESIPIFFLNDSSSSSQYAKIITFKVGLFSA